MLIWTTLTLGVDIYLGSAFFRQYKSGKYVETTGVILQSALHTQTLTMHTGDSYLQTNTIIRYSYQVDSRRFVSKKYRYFFSTAGQVIAASYLPGAMVPVFYNPQNPSEAVLSRGISKRDVCIIEFVGAFNLLLPIGWWVARKSGARRYPQSIYVRSQ
jgi:hypothetical protein